jgi:hypothetical protein
MALCLPPLAAQEEAPESMFGRTAGIAFTPAEGETVYSVLVSQDGTAATIAVSRKARLGNTLNYYVYQVSGAGRTSYGPFQEYVQHGDWWEAYNSGKSKYHIGTAKTVYQSEETTNEYTKITAILDYRLIIAQYGNWGRKLDYDTYFDGKEAITITDYRLNPATGDMGAYTTKKDDATTLHFGGKTYGPFADENLSESWLHDFSVSPDGKSIAYACSSVTKEWHSYSGNYSWLSDYERVDNSGKYDVYKNDTLILRLAEDDEVWKAWDIYLDYDEKWEVYDSSCGLQWSPDGKNLYHTAAGSLYRDGAVYAKDTKLNGPLIFSKDGTQILYATRGGSSYVYVNGKKLGPFSAGPEGLAFAFGDDTPVFKSGNTLYVEFKEGEELVTLESLPQDTGAGIKSVLLYAQNGVDYLYDYRLYTSDHELNDFVNGVAPGSGILYALEREVVDGNYQYNFRWNGKTTTFKKEPDTNFYHMLLSADGTKYAVIFMSVFYDDEHNFIWRSGAKTVYYFSQDTSELKTLCTLGEDESLITVGLDKSGAPCAAVQRAGRIYIVGSDGWQYGPYEALTTASGGSLCAFKDGKAFLLEGDCWIDTTEMPLPYIQTSNNQ